MGWFSDAWDATTNAVGSAYTAVSNGVSSAARTVEVAAQGAAKGIATAAGAVGDLAVDVAYNHTTRHAINLFKENDLDVADLNLDAKASEAVTWTEAQNEYEQSVMDKTQFGAELVAGTMTGGAGLVALAASDDSKSGRTVEVFGQGVTKGLASSVGFMGDFAVDVGYNWTTRHLLGTDAAQTNMADGASQLVSWTEPQDDYEKKVMAAGQVTGEVAGFVAVSVVSAGAVGAGLGAVRGTAVGARVISAGGRLAGTVSKVPVVGQHIVNGSAAIANATGRGAALGTARMMNPFASKLALGIEGLAGAWSFSNIMDTAATPAEKAEAAERLRLAMLESAENSLESVANDVAQESILITAYSSAIDQEMTQIVEQFNALEANPSLLTFEQQMTLAQRVDELSVASYSLQEIISGEASEERKAEIFESLERVTGINAEDIDTSYVSQFNTQAATTSAVQDDASEELEQSHTPQVPEQSRNNRNEDTDATARNDRDQSTINAELARINSLSGDALSAEFNTVVQKEGLTIFSSFNMLAASILNAIGLGAVAEQFERNVVLDNLSSEFNQMSSGVERTAMAEQMEVETETELVREKNMAPAP